MKENKNFKRLVIFTIAATMCLSALAALPSVSAAVPVCGTYTPGPGVATTWQTYWDDGTYYGDGPLEVDNVIMGWQSIMSSLWDLCPNTLVNSPNPATDLIITSVNPDPPGSGVVDYNVTYTGGELQLSGALWGGSGSYMADLDGATADATINWTGGVPTSGCDENGASCVMDIIATGTFVDHPSYDVTFSATFISDYICSGGFSGTPSDVTITIAPAPVVNLTVSPSTKTVDVGESFSLEIWAEVEDFETGDYWKSASVGLEFDPTYLQLDNASVNSAFIGMFPGGTNNDWDAGYAWFNVESGDDINSDVRLATLNFTALAPVDPTQLDIADYLRDAVNPTKVYRIDGFIPGVGPDYTFYNLGGSIPGGTQSPIGNRGSGEVVVCSVCADSVYVDDDAASSWYDCDHVASIQTAIDRACDGGTVNVHPGTYVEDIMINVEDMTLTSTGATEDTKINGAPGGTSDVVTISAGNVTIDGFYITACISGASDGIDVRSDYNTISNNIVSGNPQGIYLNTSSDHNTVSNNTVLDNSGGIWLRGSSYNIISNNNASSNMNGIYGDQSSGNNTISNNKVDSNNMFGIYLVNCNYNLISNNTATNNNFGICTMASSHNEISNCTASNNIYDGIRLWSSSCYNTIIYCDIKNNGQIGICLDSGTSSNEAHYNNIVGNVDYGVDNAGTNQFNATCNWWGHAYGPLATDNVDYVPPTGKIGDSVSNYVDYTGWLDNHDVCTGVPEYDINMDGIINIVDINAVAAIFGNPCSPPGGIREDVSDDGIIDILDLQMVAYYFGDGGWE